MKIQQIPHAAAVVEAARQIHCGVNFDHIPHGSGVSEDCQHPICRLICAVERFDAAATEDPAPVVEAAKRTADAWYEMTDPPIWEDLCEVERATWMRVARACLAAIPGVECDR